MNNEFASLICAHFGLYKLRNFIELSEWLAAGGGRSSVDELADDELRRRLEEPKHWWDAVLREQETLRRLGAEILHPMHPQFPPNLLQLAVPPLFLSWWGARPLETHEVLAVVGSRQPSFEANLWLDLELANLLKGRNLAIASGGARGIDQKAHRLAIEHQRPTLLFLPSGLNNLYPKEIYSWIPAIHAMGGAIVSEFSVAREMRKHHFYLRNRLIAGIANLVLIVEARRRSGTMLTAHQALELDRPIGVLPGLATRGHALGNLDLLAHGVPVVRDHYDLRLMLDREAVRCRPPVIDY